MLYDGGARSGGSRRRADGVGVSWDAYPVPSVAAVAASSVARHAIDAAPARWRGGAGASPLDGARTAAPSPRHDIVKNCRHPTHWLISTQAQISLSRRTGGDPAQGKNSRSGERLGMLSGGRYPILLQSVHGYESVDTSRGRCGDHLRRCS